MSCASNNRLCERSEAIQSDVRASRIATSPSASRNDGIWYVTLLGDFVALCESNFRTQRHEGAKNLNLTHRDQAAIHK
mgnify:CR=1 FL=1|tara:strand:- start:284 stop:517 length:234 start_codon:yes stop_codon:yes gene_type:complete